MFGIIIFSLLFSSAFALTEVLLTKSQFQDFADEMAKIALDINIEDGNITLDLSEVVEGMTTGIKLMRNQAGVLADMNSHQKAYHHDSLEQLKLIVTALDNLDANQQHRSDTMFQKFERFMEPISLVLNDINNVINTVKNLAEGIQSIFELFQGTQDEAIDAIQVSVEAIEVAVEAIATEFEVGMPVIVAEALEGASLVFADQVCGDAVLDICVYSPFGFGPIECGGSENFGCMMNEIIVTPGLKTKKKLRNKPEFMYICIRIYSYANRI